MTFTIYFNDLTEEAQARLLEMSGYNDALEANWDVFPLITMEFHEVDDEWDDDEDIDDDEDDEDDEDEDEEEFNDA